MADKSYQPTLAGLRAFVAVANKQHFSSAATTLGVSQSTLSQALAALETGLGAHLVERSTRRVLLTAEGMQLLPLAQAVVQAAEAFSIAAGGVSDPLHGSIRLGLIPTVAPYVLPTVLAGLTHRLPTLTAHVVEDQTQRLLAGLRDGALDAAMVALPADSAGVTEIPIYEEDFVLALPPGHPLAGKRRVPAAALAQLPLLLLDEGHCLRDQALDVCHKAGVRVELADTRAASLATAIQCVAGGLGVTLIPQSAVAVEAARSRAGLAHFGAPARAEG
ncbi:bacterial regulatory helix-turn-helix, lysR family protein [Mycobacterium kansasii]|uniref:Probable hydrogen peroxide-inducible genes activator n=1 Tax=Mycobacterium kansasii TaxID=1768 RepID=A0A1V3X4N7_MYCKA|nr:bacterial regulatory helix-turn-helix, lysR family protein [Mycobacterium kansasii]